MEQIINMVKELLNSEIKEEFKNPYIVMLINSKTQQLIHLVCFASQPRPQDILFLGAELATDKELNVDLSLIDDVYIVQYDELLKEWEKYN